jgi:hypothetical protein
MLLASSLQGCELPQVSGVGHTLHRCNPPRVGLRVEGWGVADQRSRHTACVLGLKLANCGLGFKILGLGFRV